MRDDNAFETTPQSDGEAVSAASGDATEPERLNDAIIIGDFDDDFLQRPVSIAWGRNQRDMRFETRTGTLRQAIVAFSTFERGQKDGKCVTQGALSGGQRIAKNSTVNCDLMIDFDTGITACEIDAELNRRGLFFVRWSTHSHLRPESTIPEAAIERFLKKSGQWPGHIGTVEVEHCVAYLRAEKKMRAEVLEGAELTARKIVDGGMKFFIKHAPLPRYRVLLVLAEPFDFANRGGSQREAIDEWKKRYAAVCDSLGLPHEYDTACVDPSRLMFTPRIPKDAEIGPGKHEIIVHAGEAFDFDAVPLEGETHIYGARNAFTDAAAKAGVNQIDTAGNGNWEKYEPETPGLKSFLIEYKDFRADDWYENLGNAARFTHPDGMDAECPNSESHSTGDSAMDRSFSIRNPDGEKAWNAWCLHQGCKDAAKGNKWFYIDKACQKFSVGVESLREFSAEYQRQQEQKKTARNATKEAEKLGADAEALKARIDTIVDKATANEKTAILKALATRDEGIETEELVLQFTGKTGFGLTKVRHLIRVEKKALKNMQATAAAKPMSDGFDEGPLQLRPVPKDKGKAATIWTDWPQKDQRDCTIARIKRVQGDDPRIFTWPDGPALWLRETDGRLTAHDITREDWQDLTTDHIAYKQLDEVIGKEKEVPVPGSILSVLGATRERRWPQMDRIVHVPVFARSGALMTKRGYDAELKVYSDPDFDPRPLPTTITGDEVQEALWLLIVQAMGDFPFTDAFDGDEDLPVKVGKVLRDDGYRDTNMDRGMRSRVNALAMLLQPFARYLINGPCPLYHVDKAAAGEGANYLMDVLGVITEGARCTPRPAANNQEELRKAIATGLYERDPILFFDNINHKIDSGELASATTAGRWKDRILGKTGSTGILPIECVWAFAGNNIQFTSELCRRVVPIRLDSGEPHPEDRPPSTFWHHPLHDWLLANRDRLVWACHVLIAKWVQDGMRPGTVSMASFDAYSAVMSGIMASAGLGGHFLANQEDYRRHRNDDLDTNAEIIERLWAAFKELPFTASEMYDTFKNPLTGGQDGTLPISGGSEGAQLKSLGWVIRQQFIGKSFEVVDNAATFRVRFLKVGNKAQSKYRLKRNK